MAIYIPQIPYTAISCGLVITETLPISIFLAVSTVNKVRYKLYSKISRISL